MNQKKPIITPSSVTCGLVDLLIKRDATGQQKYGTSLDRKDLTHAEWLQHLLEELLDGAGYIQASIRTSEEMERELRQAKLQIQLLHTNMRQVLAHRRSDLDTILLRTATGMAIHGETA